MRIGVKSAGGIDFRRVDGLGQQLRRFRFVPYHTINAGVGRIVRLAQVDKPNSPIQFPITPVNGVPHVQYQEKRGAADTTPLVPQGLPYGGNLNDPVGRMKMFQPVGGQILLARPQRERLGDGESVIP